MSVQGEGIGSVTRLAAICAALLGGQSTAALADHTISDVTRDTAVTRTLGKVFSDVGGCTGAVIGENFGTTRWREQRVASKRSSDSF